MTLVGIRALSLVMVLIKYLSRRLLPNDVDDSASLGEDIRDGVRRGMGGGGGRRRS